MVTHERKLYRELPNGITVRVKLTVMTYKGDDDIAESAFNFLEVGVEGLVNAAANGQFDFGASGAGLEDEDPIEPEPDPTISLYSLMSAVNRVPGYDKYEITGPALRVLQRQAEDGVAGPTPEDEDDNGPLTGCGDPLCGCLS